jgi:hypothetical protein
MDNEIQSLINERTRSYNRIGNLREELRLLRKRIDNINDTLLEKCQHKWEIDNSYMDEHTVYKCNICNCYPNYNVKMSIYPR